MKELKNFFMNPLSTAQKQYEALRAFFYEGKQVTTIAKEFGYRESSLYSLIKEFKKRFKEGKGTEMFFTCRTRGRKAKELKDKDYEIIKLRKQYLSVPDIKSILDSQGIKRSESYIYSVLKKEEFGRLPRRGKLTKRDVDANLTISAPKSELLKDEIEEISSPNLGVLCFLPYIKKLGIDNIIQDSEYPETSSIPKVNSILCFLALKLSNFSRYTKDDLWCMDRGLGLFAGLNVLPKAGWYTSYSHRVTNEMNINFLKDMIKIWKEQDFLSDTANLDFTAIPYWGESSHLENNWSGKRHQALPSILAALSHDPDTGIITYGNTNIRHNIKDNEILEFIDFYRDYGDERLNYLVFDSKFTTYENLAKIDNEGIKFVTIRRRGKNIVEELKSLPKSEWKSVRVEGADGKKRSLKILDTQVFIKSINKTLRQIAITGNGKIKPALVLTNENSLPAKIMIKKYAKRWLIEKTIAEQIYFFHLNKLSSSVVIKVDFDLTMTILAYNLYRTLAMDIPGFNYNTPSTIYEKFIKNSGNIKINTDDIIVQLKKKRNLPLLLSVIKNQKTHPFQWLNDKTISFESATSS